MKKLKYILKISEKYIIILFILNIIISLVITKCYHYKSKYNINTNEFSGYVVSIKKYSNKTTLIIKAKEKLLVNYYDNKEDIKIGDTIHIKGILEVPKKNTNFNLFNYKKYLYNNHIYYIVNANSIKKIKNNTNIFNYYKELLSNYINNKKSSKYLNIFILSNKNELESDVNETYQKNGLTHLFSISGMHITLILGSILKLLDKISYNRLYKYIILIIILIIYMFLTNFTPSILRSGIMFILLLINKYFNLKYKNISIIMLTLIIILLIDPFYLYNMGFQLSYLISFYLIIFSYKTKKYKNYFIKLLFTSYISFLISMPIIINTYFSINVISILINIFFIPYVSYIILPISLLNLLLPIDNVLIFLTNIMENISLYISNINITQIIFSKPNIILIFVYYIVITLTLINRKNVILLLLVILYHKLSVYFNNNLNIITLDVSNGDSILINMPFNKKNILIDTGGVYNFEVTKNITIPYLKSIGVGKIDYLIITHGDYDHIGSSIYFVNNFKVLNVIFNNNKYNELELKLITELKKLNIKYYNNINNLNLDNINFLFLNKIIEDNENISSIVTYFEYNKYKVLLMADAYKENELDIIKNTNINNIDILKVGHHGSKTSSDINFINKINPKVSLISVGRNNIYNHPSEETIKKLKNSYIYQTSLNGAIRISIGKNNYTVSSACS